VCVPTLSIGRCASPARSVSITNSATSSGRRATSAVRRVRATTAIFVDCGTLVIQILRPFSRQPLLSARAKVSIESVLLPASGSVSAMQNVTSPRTSFGSSAARISALAKRASVTPPKIGLVMNNWLSVEPPPAENNASTASAVSIMPRPEPP
jgi:hypothetical protein